MSSLENIIGSWLPTQTFLWSGELLAEWLLDNYSRIEQLNQPSLFEERSDLRFNHFHGHLLVTHPLESFTIHRTRKIGGNKGRREEGECTRCFQSYLSSDIEEGCRPKRREQQNDLFLAAGLRPLICGTKVTGACSTFVQPYGFDATNSLQLARQDLTQCP